MIQLQEDFLTKFERNEDMVVFLFLLFNADTDGNSTYSLRELESKIDINYQTLNRSIKRLCLSQMLKQSSNKHKSVLTICNYDSYKKKKTTPCNKSVTKVETPKDDKELQFQERMKSRFPNVARMDKKLTLEQYNSLLKEYSNEVILQTLLEMENWKPLCVKNKSAYLTLYKWLRMRNG